MPTRRTAARALSVLAALALLAGCGDDDGAAVRDLGADGSESPSASASASASATGAASGSGSGSATGTAEQACQPVNEDLGADAVQQVAVEALDYQFSPAELTAPAGIVTFEVANQGAEAHELAFLPGGGDVPFVDGDADEDALGAAGAFELEAFGPGQTCTATYDLEPGTYTLFCLVEAADGETHYEKGMRGTLTVG
jgi:plastocyanin